jgi:hypothetical protein
MKRLKRCISASRLPNWACLQARGDWESLWVYPELLMSELLKVTVTPHDAQVSLLHAAWQDYPTWGERDVWVACRSPRLSHPDSPPYPGIAVATRDAAGPEGPQFVRVEVWSEEEPAGLACVHETILSVGSQGVNVGNLRGAGNRQRLMLARGLYPLKVFVDADIPGEVSRVVFVIGQRTDRSAI